MATPKHLDFAERLRQACENHPHIPAIHFGRQSWLSERTNVSNEACRKWFAGLSMPRPGKIKDIAKVLDVDEAWLALGQSPTLEPRQRRAQHNIATGAVDVVAGLVEMNGGHVAFPKEDDPKRGYVHFYAIIDGQWSSFHVAMGRTTGDDAYRFDVPTEHGDCTVLGIIHARPLRPHLISLTPSLIRKHGVNHGGYREVTVTGDDGLYTSGDDVWPRVVSFTGALHKSEVA